VDRSRATARQLWQWRWPLAIGLLVGVISSSAFVLLSDRMYTSEVIAVPAEHEELQAGTFGLGGSLGQLGALAGLGSGNSAQTQQALALVRSRGFIESFIAENDLLPALFPTSRQAADGQYFIDDTELSLWDGYEKFSSEVLSVSEDINLGIVVLKIRWTDPAIASEWANSLIARANETVRGRAIEEAEASLKFLRRELETTTAVELRQAIYRLIETQISKRMLANVRPDYAFKVIDKAAPKDLDAHDYPKASILIPAGALLGTGLALFMCLLRVLIAPESSMREAM
jgi:hypothetical protein